MASSQVRERSRSVAQQYVSGDRAEARRELGELAFEALENVFPEASQKQSEPRAGAGFAMGVLVGATVTVWLLRRLRNR